MLNSKKFLALTVAAGLMITAGVGAYKYNEYQASKKVDKIVSSAPVQNMSTKAKVVEYANVLDTMADYMNDGRKNQGPTAESIKIKEPYVQKMLAEFDTYLAESERISLLDEQEQEQVHKMLADWKASDWSNLVEQQKQIHAILAKYKK